MTLTSETRSAARGETGITVRPMRKDAARNRELLIEAARVVFAQRGFDASLDDVARHAGLGVGTAYRHFANKQELASALIEQAVGELLELADQAMAVEDSWLALVGFLEGSLAVQSADRGLREVLMGMHEPQQFDHVHDRLFGTVEELVKRAQRDGFVRADAEGTDIGFLMTMVCAVAEVGGDTAPTIWRRYLAMCLEGLKPAGTTLAEPALSEDVFRTAVMNHKQFLTRPALKPQPTIVS